MAPKKLTPEKFKEIYSQVPRLTVEVIIKTPEGVVLTKRAIEPYKGYWHIPGGTVLFKETLEDAVKRVAKEEVGLGVGIERFLGFIYYHEEEKKRGYGWTVGTAFLAYVEGGRIQENGDSEEIKVFKELPEKIIKEQVNFLKKRNLLE